MKIIVSTFIGFAFVNLIVIQLQGSKTYKYLQEKEEIDSLRDVKHDMQIKLLELEINHLKDGSQGN
jgi:hypothetical protein